MQIIHEAERHLLQSKKEDDNDEDDDKGSSKEGKAKIIVKLKCLLLLTFNDYNQGRVPFRKNPIRFNRWTILQSLDLTRQSKRE